MASFYSGQMPSWGSGATGGGSSSGRSWPGYLTPAIWEARKRPIPGAGRPKPKFTPRRIIKDASGRVDRAAMLAEYNKERPNTVRHDSGVPAGMRPTQGVDPSAPAWEPIPRPGGGVLSGSPNRPPHLGSPQGTPSAQVREALRRKFAARR